MSSGKLIDGLRALAGLDKFVLHFGPGGSALLHDAADELQTASLQAPCVGKEGEATHQGILAALGRIGDAHLKSYGVQIGAETAYNIIQEMKVLALLSAQPVPDGESLIDEADIPELVERGARGETLTIAETAAWSGYELGWRDGRNDASSAKQQDGETQPDTQPSGEK